MRIARWIRWIRGAKLGHSLLASGPQWGCCAVIVCFCLQSPLHLVASDFPPPPNPSFVSVPPTASMSGAASAAGSASSMMSLARWAVLGDVLNSSKPASRIVQRLRDNHKEVHLVNPRAPSDSEPKVHASLASLVASTRIDVLDLVINSNDGLKQLSAVPENTKLSVWIQPGAASDEIRQMCKNRSWPVHEGCVLVEMPTSSKL